ncbi:hypothetical protein [Abyssalbus ytuae]|uniref:Uncharacterized protein n=1 Tax=Abyssalbus ytuae TaxID=2926907 RepID=A0A9E7CU09_9FLAO|nr:hypothetical protein [Abyssalbus ytuae]UOB17322.1 hypothetical protein MQE35_16495 [Abyssalbus ytuae]
MKKTTLLLFVLLSFYYSMQAQVNTLTSVFNEKVKGEIIFQNGKTLEGKFRVPGLNSKQIVFFDKNGNKTDLESDDIKYLISKNEQGNYSVIEYSQIGRLKKTGEIKAINKKIWLQVVVDGEKADLYIAGTAFEVNNGIIEPVAYGTNQHPPSFNYYGKMEGRDAIPVFIDTEISGTTLFKNAMFKQFGYQFFEGTPIADKIKKKLEGYRSEDRKKVFLEYNGML